MGAGLPERSRRLRLERRRSALAAKIAKRTIEYRRRAAASGTAAGVAVPNYVHRLQPLVLIVAVHLSMVGRTQRLRSELGSLQRAIL